jgi:DNA segregation ATPase FtsK/SpoIIIE, S-DNA-T family
MRDKILVQPDGSSIGWLTGSVALAVVMAIAWASWHGARLACRFVYHHRATTVALVVVLAARAYLGTTATAVVAGLVAVGLVVVRVRRPSWFRWLAEQVVFIRRRGLYRSQWRWWAFGHNLTKSRTEERMLAADRSTVIHPRLRRIRCGRHLDRLVFRPVVGQSLEQWEHAAGALTLAMGALDCRVATDRPGLLRLDVLWSDPLAAPIAALPVTETVDLSAVPIGLREDGGLWLLRLVGNHVLVAGVTGAGKSSVLHSMAQGIAPAIRDGRAQLWVIDPKGGMEFTPARPMLTRFAADDQAGMARLLAQAVEVMQARSVRYAAAGIRSYTPTTAEPLIVVLVDELAFLTAYAPDRKFREEVQQSLNVLLSKGRAVGVCVVGALQDPSKEVVKSRNLFPTKIGLRLDSTSQVDMVLGDGARDAGARCDQIPDTSPGVAFIKVDGKREPVRVRAAYVSDDDIAVTAAAYPAPGPVIDLPTNGDDFDQAA